MTKIHAIQGNTKPTGKGSTTGEHSAPEEKSSTRKGGGGEQNYRQQGKEGPVDEGP